MIKQVLFEERDSILQSVYNIVLKNKHPGVQIEYANNIDDFVNKAIKNQYDVLMSRGSNNTNQLAAAADIRKHGIDTPIHLFTGSSAHKTQTKLNNIYVQEFADIRHICDVINQYTNT